MVDYLWQLLDVDGSGFLPPRAPEDVLKRYVKEMSQLGVDSIGIVLLISFSSGR